MKKISVIIPMYNEQEAVSLCYERVSKVLQGLGNYDYEIVTINDGSTDNTLAILKELSSKDEKLKVLSFSRNFGHECATECGINNCSGDAAIIIDADLQDPPELIPEMIKCWESGSEVVYGKRKRRKGESLLKLMTAKAFYRVLDKMSDTKIPLDTGDFRLIDRKILDDISKMPEKNKFMRGLISWCGYKQSPYEYERDARVAGKTKYSFRKLMRLAGDGIISFSSKPLKFVGKLGAFSIIVSIIILIYSLVSFFTGRAIEPGWTSLMVTITFFTGVQLSCLWLIAEYISRIYENSKGRPNYIIDEKINL